MNWLKYTKFYFLLSASLIFISIFALINFGINLGIDFKGGSIIEYKFEQEISTEDLTKDLEELDLSVSAIQPTSESYIFKFDEITKEKKDEITEFLNNKNLKATELRFENVGPSIGPELVQKTALAILLSAGAILIWVGIQFKSLKFGLSAILAMLHDSFILIGSFALFGHFFGAETDFLFVTALLTTLSFSVHDTIVVYDRIREIRKKHGGETCDIANRAVSETMRRSINNSVTIALMLLSLALLGGTTVRWFAVALLTGTILGTYSSPFVAVPLLVTFDEKPRLRKRNISK